MGGGPSKEEQENAALDRKERESEISRKDKELDLGAKIKIVQIEKEAHKELEKYRETLRAEETVVISGHEAMTRQEALKAGKDVVLGMITTPNKNYSAGDMAKVLKNFAVLGIKKEEVSSFLASLKDDEDDDDNNIQMSTSGGLMKRNEF